MKKIILVYIFLVLVGCGKKEEAPAPPPAPAPAAAAPAPTQDNKTEAPAAIAVVPALDGDKKLSDIVVKNTKAVLDDVFGSTDGQKYYEMRLCFTNFLVIMQKDVNRSMPEIMDRSIEMNKRLMASTIDVDQADKKINEFLVSKCGTGNNESYKQCLNSLPAGVKGWIQGQIADGIVKEFYAKNGIEALFKQQQFYCSKHFTY